MAIVKYPNKLLRKISCPVQRVGETENVIFRDMQAIMKSTNGIGFAAPQIGISSRLVVAEVGDHKVQLANPVITKRWGTDVMEEGCLSLPGIRVFVKRAREITVTGLDEKGEQMELEAKGLIARVLQHEIDHLNGRLIIDSLSLWQRLNYYIKRKRFM